MARGPHNPPGTTIGAPLPSDAARPEPAQTRTRIMRLVESALQSCIWNSNAGRASAVADALVAAQTAEQRELEALRDEHRELSDQFIANAQRLGSVCDNWHNWAVEIVGKEAARKMSGQDMRDEISRRLAELAALREFERDVRAACERVCFVDAVVKAIGDLDRKRATP